MVFGLIFRRLLPCTISSNEQFLFFSGAKGAEGIKMFRKEPWRGSEKRRREDTITAPPGAILKMMQKIIIFTDFHFYRLENGFLRDLNRLLLNSVTFDEQYVHIFMRKSCETP